MNCNTPVDMPRGTHYGNNYYEVYSVKARRRARFYSELEYYNFLSLEMDFRVKALCEQPLAIESVVDGKTRKVVFDMWLRYQDGREEMQEVKYAAELTGTNESARRSQEQIRHERVWCETNGIGFKVRTEQDICGGRFRVGNLHLLAARNRWYDPQSGDAYWEPLREMLSSRVLVVSDLLRLELLPALQPWEFLSRMYYMGRLGMELDRQPLGARTEVELCPQE